MTMIPGFNPFSADSGYTAAENCSYTAARVSETAVAGGQSTDITIVTDEKDKVTLSFAADYQSSYATYSALAASRNGYANIEGQDFNFDLSLEQSIRVEGDLNEQEIKDIKKVLKRLGRIMNNFLSGRIDDVAHKAGRLLKSMQTIDSVEARFEVAKKVAVVDQQYVEATALSSFEGDRLIEPQPLPPELSHESTPIRELTDDMVAVVRASQVDFAKMSRFIDRFFRRLLGNIARGGLANRNIMNLARLIQSDFLQQLQNLSAKSG